MNDLLENNDVSNINDTSNLGPFIPQILPSGDLDALEKPSMDLKTKMKTGHNSHGENMYRTEQ